MKPEMLLQARRYVLSAAGRNVMAVSASAVARQVTCTEAEANELLLRLQEEGLVEIRGFLTCPECGEYIGLKACTLEGIIIEAHAMSGKACRHCGQTLPEKEEVRLRFSFFCSAVAQTEGATATAATAAAPLGSPYSLADLELLLERLRPHVYAGDGSQVLLNSSLQQSAGGTIGGVHSGRVTAMGNRGMVGAAAATPARSTASQAESAASRYWVWISLGAALAVAVFLLFRLPSTLPRVDLSIIGGGATFLVVMWFHPGHWHRRLISTIVGGWLLIRGGGIAAYIYADSPWGKYFASIDTATPFVFDFVALLLVMVVFWANRAETL